MLTSGASKLEGIGYRVSLRSDVCNEAFIPLMMSILNCTVVISEILTLSLYAYGCYSVEFFLREASSSGASLKLIAFPSCQ